MTRDPIADGAAAAAELLTVMARLRRKGDGCPWDLEQDHRTLRPYLLEEAYEVLEAIDAGDDTALCEELGDLFLQVVFHARMAEERGAFAFADLARGIARKLERRHPHIFADVKVSSSAQVMQNWESIKKKEKARDSVLDGVPAALPALSRASRIQEKAAAVGFDWKHAAEVAPKIAEEAREFAEAAAGEPARAADELGDLFFSLVNWARKMKLDPEAALREATARFERRFRAMERSAGRPLKEHDQAGLEELWESAKAAERA